MAGGHTPAFSFARCASATPAACSADSAALASWHATTLRACAGLQRLDLEGSGDTAAYTFLHSVTTGECRATIKHLSLVPKASSASSQWRGGEAAQHTTGLLPALQALESVQLPLPYGMLRATVGCALQALPHCASVTLAKPNGRVADNDVVLLAEHLFGLTPIPQVRELELAGLRFDGGGGQAAEAWLGCALLRFVGVTTLRLRSSGDEAGGLGCPVDHQPVVAAAVQGMPQLQRIEAVARQGGQEECTVLFRLPEAAESVSQEEPAAGVGGFGWGRKRERGCDGCGYVAEAGPGVLTNKWRRRSMRGARGVL